MIIKISSSILLISLVIFFLGSSQSYFALNDFFKSIITIAAVTIIPALFISLGAIFLRERRKSQGSLESQNNTIQPEFDGEEFHNDFSKVPGGNEVGMSNIPHPQTQVLETRILYPEPNVVMVDLARIGIVENPEKKN